MNSAVGTHDVVNQAPPLLGVNLFTSDPALSALVEGMPNSILDELAAHGQTWGTPETFELGRIANANPPLLKAFDPNGVRIDSVEFHPAYHALMRRSIAAGMHASIWDATNAESSVRSLARAARLYMTAEAEAGHLVSPIMTNASVAALAHAPEDGIAGSR